MRLTAKVPFLTLGLLAAMHSVSVAHAANPLEQIANQQVDKFQQRSNETHTSCRDERNLRSVQGNVHTAMKFVNRTHQEIRSYWLDYNGRRVFYKAIPPNGNYTQPTFQTHPWVITDQRDNCLDIYVSNQPSAFVEIR